MRPSSSRNATSKSAKPHIITPSPLHHQYHRDSDVSSLNSQNLSRASSALLADGPSRSAALRSINAYLSSISAPFFLKAPLPSAKDITSCFRLFLARLHFENASNNLDEDVIVLLKSLDCPIKFRRSAFKAPGTPHSWPELLSILYWLLQEVRYIDHLFSTPSPAPSHLLSYTSNSYSLFINGRDEEAEMLDEESKRILEAEVEKTVEDVARMEKEAADLEERVRVVKMAPSVKEEKEGLRDNLKEDVRKFEVVVERYNKQVREMEKEFKESEEKLDAKEKERERIGLENEELKKKIEEQGVNARDVERMRREMEILDREIVESESGRDAMEDKGWELDEAIRKAFKELNVLVEQCNQAIRQLKLGDDLQLVLNHEGSTLPEILGVDYKNILKPSLDALLEDTKRASAAKSDELNSLVHQSREKTAMLEEKKATVGALKSEAGEIEAQLNSLQKEIDRYASKCAAEAKRLQEEHAKKEQDLNSALKEAEELLKSREKELEDSIKERNEETQACARELLATVDSVSEYKEFVESQAAIMKIELKELLKFVETANTAAVSAKINSINTHRNLKRSRLEHVD